MATRQYSTTETVEDIIRQALVEKLKEEEGKPKSKDYVLPKTGFKQELLNLGAGGATAIDLLMDILRVPGMVGGAVKGAGEDIGKKGLGASNISAAAKGAGEGVERLEASPRYGAPLRGATKLRKSAREAAGQDPELSAIEVIASMALPGGPARRGKKGIDEIIDSLTDAIDSQTARRAIEDPDELARLIADLKARRESFLGNTTPQMGSTPGGAGLQGEFEGMQSGMLGFTASGSLERDLANATRIRASRRVETEGNPPSGYRTVESDRARAAELGVEEVTEDTLQNELLDMLTQGELPRVRTTRAAVEEALPPNKYRGERRHESATPDDIRSVRNQTATNALELEAFSALEDIPTENIDERVALMVRTYERIRAYSLDDARDFVDKIGIHHMELHLKVDDALANTPGSGYVRQRQSLTRRPLRDTEER